jgi:peroxiredoxin
MNRVIKSLATLVCLLIFIGLALADLKPPAEGDQLPGIVLSVPQNPAHREYLGLTAGASFTIPQIKAKVVIIEIFSMYCPYCQKEAPVVNELYRKIQHNSRFKASIKLIGIGVGNTAFEVDHFRNTYQIPFPLFSDSDFAIHKKIGEVRTPYFFGIGINEDGAHRILYSKRGGLKDPDQFINMMLQRVGLK